ncbi:MAG TPA: BamA/TamA family outer membrane protein [Thermoanaerobaculia bacterium]|nr:BamA/TamA family outer membrane protein [Thermoanaerobaculia bacterium]
MIDQQKGARRASCLAVALCILATGAAAAQAPQFVIETIEVTGLPRPAAQGIVLAESRLVTGQSYSESQLAEAVYRVRRLPFVLDAQFALKKGTERGAYVLVITIEPTRPVFYEVGHSSLIGANGELEIEGSTGASFGARQFVGRHGLLFGSVLKGEGLDEIPLELGYTHYDVFGTGSFVTVIAAGAVGSDERDTYSLQAEIGVPLDLRQSLRGQLAWSEADLDERRFGGDPGSFNRRSSEALSAALSWVYDTTDDPFFPTRGTRGVVGTSIGRSRTSGSLVFLDQRFDEDREQTLWRVAAEGLRHYRVSPRQTLSAGAGAVWFRSEVEGNAPAPLADFSFDRESYSAQVSLGYALDVLPAARPIEWGDLRWETRLALGFVDPDDAFAVSSTSATLSTSVVFRHAWGLSRLTLTYLEAL